MNALVPHKVWWTPLEIAEACLPDMPTTDRGARKLAANNGWAKRAGCVRRRPGKGGGFEYHYSLFPLRARDWLVASAIKAETDPEQRGRDEAWATFEALDQKAKDKAYKRAEICREVVAAQRAGATRTYAVDRAAARHDVSARSIANWLKTIQRVRVDDWAPALAGKHKAAARDVRTAEFSDDAWAFFKADYLRPEGPGIAACVRRLRRVGASEGWVIPSEQKIRRLIRQRISKQALTLARKGVAALKDMTPPVIRDKSMLHAMQMVDADFHKFDVFVDWLGDGVPIRPQMCAIHDLYSGRIVGWRMAETPNAVTVMLTVGDVIEDYGIPSDIYIDNGREFAAKWITGGAENRFRFKVNNDDPLGVLPQMGVNVHFTTPYSGQSKPIERSFRDLCEDVAKDPRFRGAYVGNRPDAKPENYGSRAVPRDQFMRIVAEGIAEFNARTGRRAAVCKGRSFDQVFAASYSTAPIKKAAPEQARLWLLGSQVLTGNRSSGELSFQGNKYWADWMAEIAGEKIVARFDPEDLHAGLHVYQKDGAYLGHADCRQPEGFADLDAAREIARRRSQLLKATRAQLKAQVTLDNAQMDQLLDNAAPATAPVDLDAKVIAADFRRKAPADIMAKPNIEAPVTPISDEEAAAHQATIIALTQPAKPAASVDPTPEDLYLRARDMIARRNEGEMLGAAEERWLQGYITHPDFIAHQKMAEAFGDQFLEGGAGRGAE